MGSVVALSIQSPMVSFNRVNRSRAVGGRRGGGGGREEDNGNIDGINGTEEGRQRMDERFVMNVSKDALGVSMRQSMLMRQEEEEVEAEEVDRGGGGGGGSWTKRRWWLRRRRRRSRKKKPVLEEGGLREGRNGSGCKRG